MTKDEEDIDRCEINQFLWNSNNESNADEQPVDTPKCYPGLETLTTLRNRILIVNHTVADIYLKNVSIQYCGYIPFWRHSGPLTEFKHWIIWGEFQIFHDKVCVQHEFIKVECYSQHDLVIYRNIHAQIIPVSVKVVPERTAKDSNEYNVLMLGIDSVSRMSLLRNVPDLDLYIREELHGIRLDKFNKVKTPYRLLCNY